MKTLGAVIMAVGLLWTTTAIAWQSSDLNQAQIGQTIEEFTAMFGQPMKPIDKFRGGTLTQLSYTVQQGGNLGPVEVRATFQDGKLVDLNHGGFSLKETGACGRAWYGKATNGPMYCGQLGGTVYEIVGGALHEYHR